MTGTAAPDEELNRAGFLLRMSALFGLIAGLAEVVLFAAQKILLHLFIFVGRDLVWMAPLSELILFLTFGLLFVLARRLIPRLTWIWAFRFFASLAVSLDGPAPRARPRGSTWSSPTRTSPGCCGSRTPCCTRSAAIPIRPRPRR